MLGAFYRVAGHPLTAGVFAFAVAFLIGVVRVHMGLAKLERVLPTSLLLGAFVAGATYVARSFSGKD